MASSQSSLPASPRSDNEMLTRLDDLSASFQREGKYLDALECLERGLVLRHKLHGAGSAEVLGACKATAELCNLLAMTYLQQDAYPMAAELLKKAEILTEHDLSGRAVTYNNFACYSRQQGKLHAALMYLQKALKIEQKLEMVENPADTHLNLCAVMSQLGQHRAALEHSQAALTLLQQELFNAAGSGEAAGAEAPPAPAAPKADRVAVLAICYHNIGVECEFLKHYQASLQAYTKGVEIASVYLGDEHGITGTLKRSQATAKKVIARAQAAAEKAAATRRAKVEAGRVDHGASKATLHAGTSKSSFEARDRGVSPRDKPTPTPAGKPDKSSATLVSAGAASIRSM